MKTGETNIGQAPHIPLVKALKVKVLGRAAAHQMLPPLVSVLDWQENTDLKMPTNLDFAAYAEIGFRATAPKDGAERVRRHAVRAICHHIYGPIEQELHLVLHRMWELGLSSSDPAVQRIERLIVALRGEDAAP